MATFKYYDGTKYNRITGGLVPKTVNTTSDTETYSCNYVNNEVDKLLPENSKTTGTTNTYSCDYINSLKPSAITVGLTNDTTFTTSSLIVPLDKVVGSTGSKFELINNKIKIGAGVTKIKVSGSLTEESTSTGLFGFYISKNATNLDSAINVGFNSLATANEMYKITCTPVIVDVTPGDLIMLNAYTQNPSATVTIKGYAGKATNITIEEV